MFERFTDRARQTVVVAQEEARRLGHDYIGTEHLLLGLLGEPDGVAAKALNQLGISLEATRARVESIIGRGSGEPTGQIPFTPRAKKVLELSLREALQLGHNYIGTEHVLLGLVREGEGVAAQVLVQQGAGLAQIRKRVLALLSGQEPSAAHASRRTPGAEEAMRAAEQLAAGAPMGSQHLLEALARSEDSAAARALAALGIDPDRLAAAIDEIELEGTTDLTAEAAAVRKAELRLVGDEAHLVLRDSVTVGLVRDVTSELGGPIRGDDPVVRGLVEPWRAIIRFLEELGRELRADVEPEARRLTKLTVVQRAIQSRRRRHGPEE